MVFSYCMSALSRCALASFTFDFKRPAVKIGCETCGTKLPALCGPLNKVDNCPHSAWSFVPQVSQPIFTAGRLKSNVKLAKAQRESALIQYEKTIQTAFTDVSNALIAHQRVRESRLKQEALVATLQDRTRLAYVRYQGGVDTQLNALDADRDLFQAQLNLAEIRLNELLSVVQLYKALGGGWS